MKNFDLLINIGAYVNPCTKLVEPLKFIGAIVLIVKIVVPILLASLGSSDLIKAVTAGKDGELPKAIKGFGMRIVAGVFIFFVPTIISFVFTLVDSWASVEADYNVCVQCIFNVNKCNAENQSSNSSQINNQNNNQSNG